MLGSSSFTGNQINFDNNGKEIEVPDGQNAAIVSLAGCNSDNSNQVAILNNIKNYANFNNCNFNNVSIGLNRDAIIGSRISRLGVDYSSFTNFDGTAIDLFLCNGMKGGIKGNYFTCDYFHDLVHPIIFITLSTSLFDIVQDTLINNSDDMNGIVIQGTNSYNIGHNLISYASIPINSLSRGISIGNFKDENMTITTSNGLRIHDNSIIGAASGTNNMIGIYLQNTIETDVSCNSINRILGGVSIEGSCGLTLRWNQFDNYRYGVHTNYNAYGGPQDNTMNSFLVNSNPSSTYDIFCQGPPTSTLFTQQYTNYPYWPNVVNNSSVRTQGGTERTTSSCQSAPNSPPIFCCPNFLNNPRINELIVGTYSPVTGQNGREWHEKYMIYSYFKNHQTYIDDDADYEDYMDSIQDYSNVADFYRIISGIDTLFAIRPTLTDTLDRLHERIKINYLQIDTITLSRGSNPTELQIDTILGLKLPIENSLDTLEEQYLVLYDSLHELKNLQLDSLLIIHGNITPDNSIETDLKSVLKVYLDLLLEQVSELTEAQVDTLELVADKCYLTNGLGVSMLRVEDDLDANCEEPLILTDKKIKSEPELLRLRKTNDGFLVFNASNEGGLLKIITIEGKILFSLYIERDKEIKINDNGYGNNSLIFINFTTNNGINETFSYFK
ncbi:MAG: hypothetical protein IPG12_06040 [Saprospiraceae bacterium]|nr:hypothetical protein [Saprospiraceae bacterium]